MPSFLMSGNEAITRDLYEVGGKVASACPWIPVPSSWRICSPSSLAVTARQVQQKQAGKENENAGHQ